jgi:hypothetical protein
MFLPMSGDLATPSSSRTLVGVERGPAGNGDQRVMFRLVLAAAQAGRGQRRNQGRSSVSRTRSPQPIRMRETGGPTVDARAAGAEDPMAAFPA